MVCSACNEKLAKELEQLKLRYLSEGNHFQPGECSEQYQAAFACIYLYENMVLPQMYLNGKYGFKI